jgi:hypothetical protein|nr:MAG TPA: protein of unknown function DUF4373 [Caudoviricetes sp.]
MGRPTKETVDYYPHFVKGGRTIFILESKYGNDGYAFWFKLLEILGDAEGHYYDCSVPNNWAYLLAKTRCSEDTAKDIINSLLALGKIDSKLWNDRQVIWCQHFVDNLSSVYKRRNIEAPTKPSFYDEKPQRASVSVNENHSKRELIDTEITKEKESREKKRIYPYQDIVALWNEICGNCLPKVKALNENRRQKIKCRLDEWSKDSGEWMTKAQELFERVITSDFLRGNNNTGWAATFDWLFENPKNWVKVIEGNYDNNRGAKGSQHQQHTKTGITLGVGEYIEPLTGRRTYGTGKATIPPSAPARPSERHSWDSVSKSWVLL